MKFKPAKPSGKRMEYSQAVIGHSSKRTRKPSVGKIVTSSAGTVDMKPPRRKPGKRVF